MTEIGGRKTIIQDSVEDRSFVAFDLAMDYSEMDFDGCTAEFFRVVVRVDEFVLHVISRDWIYE